MQEFFTAISNFGFPVVVAGYLLFRFETKIEKLTESISNPEKGLIVTIQHLSERVDLLSTAVNKNSKKQ